MKPLNAAVYGGIFFVKNCVQYSKGTSEPLCFLVLPHFATAHASILQRNALGSDIGVGNVRAMSCIHAADGVV